MSAAPEAAPGWIEASVQIEFPELALHELELAPSPRALRRSPAGVRARLRMLSDRVAGAQAIALRSRPVPAAYRAFFRQIGLDPESDRTPIEAAMLTRLIEGGFVSRTLLDDARLIALVETGVAVWALDAGALEGPLGIREARAGERLGELPLSPGRLVVADAGAPVCVLFGEVGAAHAVGPETGRIRLFVIQVAGVPGVHVEEALWLCRSAL